MLNERPFRKHFGELFTTKEPSIVSFQVFKAVMLEKIDTTKKNIRSAALSPATFV